MHATYITVNCQQLVSNSVFVHSYDFCFFCCQPRSGDAYVGEGGGGEVGIGVVHEVEGVVEGEGSEVGEGVVDPDWVGPFEWVVDVCGEVIEFGVAVGEGLIVDVDFGQQMLRERLAGVEVGVGSGG